MTLTLEQCRTDELLRIERAVDELSAAQTMDDMWRADRAADARINAAIDADLISEQEGQHWHATLDRARFSWLAR